MTDTMVQSRQASTTNRKLWISVASFTVFVVVFVIAAIKWSQWEALYPNANWYEDVVNSQSLSPQEWQLKRVTTGTTHDSYPAAIYWFEQTGWEVKTRATYTAARKLGLVHNKIVILRWAVIERQGSGSHILMTTHVSVLIETSIFPHHFATKYFIE